MFHYGLLFSLIGIFLHAGDLYQFQRTGVFLYKAITILFILFTVRAAAAQDMPDSTFITDEISVISFRNEGDILNSASSIHLIDSEHLGRLNGRNAGEILSTVPGVFIKTYGNASSLQTISINGLGAEHTIILLNGTRMNSFQNGQIDLSLIPKESIKRIEVLSNGYSSVYGPEAMSGVVNIITDEDAVRRPGTLSASLDASYGSFNNRKVSLSGLMNGSNYGFDYLISKEESDNDFSYYFNTGERTEKRSRQNAGYTNDNYAFTFRKDLSKTFKAKLYTQYINSDKNVPGIETGNVSPLTVQRDRNWNTVLDLDFKKGNFTLHNTVDFQNNLMNYVTAPVLDSYYKNIFISNSTRLNYGTRDFLSILGLELMHGTLVSDQTEDGVARNQFSVFSSTNIKLKRVIFYPSARYDYISDIRKSVWTYKLGVNYRLPLPFDARLRSNYGRNFRAPTFNELYWKESGNKNIIPEESNNFEAGAIVTGEKPFSHILDISYVYIDAKNRILWLPGPDRIWRPINILSSSSKIFNSSLIISYNIGRKIGVTSEVSYTINTSVKKRSNYEGDVTTGKQMIYIPKEQGKISLGIKYSSFEINLFYAYTGTRYSDAQNLSSMPPVSTLDANIKYTLRILRINALIKFDVNNLTNTDYQYVSGYPLPLRNYLLTLNLKYSK